MKGLLGLNAMDFELNPYCLTKPQFWVRGHPRGSWSVFGIFPPDPLPHQVSTPRNVAQHKTNWKSTVYSNIFSLLYYIYWIL